LKDSATSCTIEQLFVARSGLRARRKLLTGSGRKRMVYRSWQPENSTCGWDTGEIHTWGVVLCTRRLRCTMVDKQLNLSVFVCLLHADLRSVPLPLSVCCTPRCSLVCLTSVRTRHNGLLRADGYDAWRHRVGCQTVRSGPEFHACAKLSYWTLPPNQCHGSRSMGPGRQLAS
jgi:hypothetical protein